MEDARPIDRRLVAVARAWPAAVAGLFPVLQVPLAVDGYILPRVLLLLLGGAVGLVLCGLLQHRPGRPSPRGLGVPALATAIAALLALAFSVSPAASLAGEYLRDESAVVRLAYPLLFGVTAWLLAAAGPSDRRRVVSWFLAGCSVAALEALWEWIAFHLGLAGGLERADGNLGNAALLGALMAMAAPILLGRILGGGWRWVPVLVIVLAGLAASTSRSAWLGALLAMLVLVGLRVPRNLRRAAAGGLLAVLAAVALLAARLATLNSDPYSLRLALWERVIPMVLARPLFGWGEDTMGLVFGAYARGFLPGITFDRAHSQVLDLLVAQGLVGLAALTWFWAAYAIGMLREGRWRLEENAPLLAAMLAYSTWAAVNFDWVPATGPLWLLAGVAWSVPQMATAESRPAAPRTRFAMLAAGGLAAAGAAYFGIVPLAADLAYHAGEPGQAVALFPLQARYHRALGDDLVAAGRVAAGAAELRRAGDLGDSDATTWVELGDAETTLGDAAAARAAYARARAIDPAIVTP